MSIKREKDIVINFVLSEMKLRNQYESCVFNLYENCPVMVHK